ncbi:hypothetical protein LCM4577_21600 [Mesorhizobium sp. LCM 4577]|uniref:BPSL0067 family protein n=1 Tax=unclassified Mesorhizobium TaxID=325217 RepID=UPI0008D9D8F3|nr:MULTISPECIES: BPSL0067 family protein [unclassified Mesorhizobium]OHV69219.1 hypothetical protein LCM4577_21600 [Mesorhizobium sp. LCM 4577]OHV73889.1 hypothetical protein LCM4576_16685 [Mesorhizobium sp. LCM 4576]
MELNAGSGIALDPAEDQTEVTGENAGASDQSADLAPLYDRVEQALAKDRPVDAMTDKDRPLAAMLADLTPASAAALARRARAANVSQQIGARANISLAFQNAPKAFADTGSYSGVMPKPEDFAYVFGVEEGRRQLAKFDQSVETGKQAFDMRVMPARDLNSQLLDAAVGAANSPEGQSRYRITAAAAQHVLEARQNDPAGEAINAFPQANEAWRAAAAQGWRDPAAVQNALALTIATQRYLGIENAQPVPRSVLKDLGALAPQDMRAGMNGLLAGTTDPVVKAAVKQQFAEAGLLGGPAQKATPLGQDDFDKRFGAPSKAPLAGEDASSSTQASEQSDETLGAANSPVAADSISQISTSELADEGADPPVGLEQGLPEQIDLPPERPDVPPATSDPAPQSADDNSNLPVDLKEVPSEQMEPPPGSPKAPSIDFSKKLPQSKNLSEGWFGNSTTNISVLPEDVQARAKPYTKILGKSFGNGQCVALTKEVGGMAGIPASTWKKGEKIQGNNKIPPGTPIATFNGDWGDGKGRIHYGPKGQAGGVSGFSHTGIYLGQNESGIFILDQWKGRNANIIFRPWQSAGQGLESGAYYYLIER